ncbi:MAG: 4-hydroxyphenylacetate 3-hydroxylase family protein [bacterium]|jgi:4-hydroxyphenylacetate 3-monooxygenase|nr:4-hydroxyphenylacetate 3-hydroxylase family protein [bacterium]
METVTRSRPLSSEEYLESLRDGRQIYIDGEQVADVTTHPAFRNAARSISRLYDALHDDETRDATVGRDRQGILTHKFFKPAYSAQELLEARDAIAVWARLTYGFMGRSPDYKAAFMATLGSFPEFYEPFVENARSWYREYASTCLYLNHVLINPPVDRNRPVHEIADVYLHVVDERDDGIVVNGAKMLATGSAVTHATFVAQNSAVTLEAGKAEDYALVFIARMDTPGQKLICRPSYESRSVSPFDSPLASRFDENDAFVVFDNAFIPWENVLVYRAVQKANAFFPQSGFFNRYNLQASTRLAVKLDFFVGLLTRALAANGTDQFRGNQVLLGEVMSWRNLAWAMTQAMASDVQEAAGGAVLPKTEHATAARVFATMATPRVKEIFELILGGSPLVLPSSYKDLENEELAPIFERFYRASSASGDERVKLFKLIWDALGTEFGGRHELYERNYSGNHEQIRLDALNFSRGRGAVDDCLAMVDRCLADYDLGGWAPGTPWTWDGRSRG